MKANSRSGGKKSSYTAQMSIRLLRRLWLTGQNAAIEIFSHDSSGSISSSTEFFHFFLALAGIWGGHKSRASLVRLRRVCIVFVLSLKSVF